MNKYRFILAGLLEIAITSSFGIFCYFFILENVGITKPHQHLSSVPQFSDFVLAFLFFTHLLARDSFKGGGLIKRLFGIQIESISGQPIKTYQLLIRSLSQILLPFELIFLFINPRRRIGDYLAKTQLVNEKPQALGINMPQAILGVATSMILSYYVVNSLYISTDLVVNQSSYSEEKSDQYEKIIQELLISYGATDVKVYEEIENIDSTAFVSIILYLNNDYTLDGSIKDIENLSQIYFDALFKDYQSVVRFRLTRREKTDQYLNEIVS